MNNKIDSTTADGSQPIVSHRMSIRLSVLGLVFGLCAAVWLLTNYASTEINANDAPPVSVVAPDQTCEIELLDTLQIPGNARDRSGLATRLEGEVPHDQLGGFSAIAYSGKNNIYYLLPDRGPADGSVPYQCRFHTATIEVRPGQDPALTFELIGTQLLTDEQGRALNGSAESIDARNPHKSLRFDPEGIRIGQDGTVYLCDEYGPHLFAFSSQGKLTRRFKVPEHLQVKTLSPSKVEEIAINTRGRQTNRGFEGLAISADCSKLYPILQGPLLQDHPFDTDGERLGKNIRFLEFDQDSNATREFVYVLDDPNNGISEVLRFDEDRFLVLERDSKEGTKAKYKRLYLADLKEASDITGVDSLPAENLPQGLRAMSKELFLDLLDSRFKLPLELIPTKVEGIAFGPDLADGRRLLIVCTDNDFQADDASLLYAFAVGAPAAKSEAGEASREVSDLGETPRAKIASGLMPPAQGVELVNGLRLRRDRSLFDGDPPRNADGTQGQRVLYVAKPVSTSHKKSSFHAQRRRFIAMFCRAGCCLSSESLNLLSHAKLSRMHCCRMRDSSSRNTMSNIQWQLFSMAQ